MASSKAESSSGSGPLAIDSPSENRHLQHAPSQKTLVPRWTKRKERSRIARICTWVVDHQISISATLIALLSLVHGVFPEARHHTEKFFHISYYNPRTNRHALGWDDIFFVFFWIVVFTGLRCAVMDYVLAPFGAMCGLRKQKQRVRFAEQAWIFLYYTASSLVGFSIVYHSDYWGDLQALWRDWPVREMDGFNKWYYLVQFAFWLQQIVVVNIEERRKDHWQMFSHHIITCLMIFTSYGYHFTKVGTLILVLMDVADLFLPLAKMLRYLKFQMACDITFGVFLITWFVTRHVLYGMTWWSGYSTGDINIKRGCYVGSYENLQGPFPVPNDWKHVIEPFRDPVGQVCYNGTTKWVFLSFLLTLQSMLVVWFCMIVRVAYRVISGQGADDVRSDDENEDEQEEEQEKLIKETLGLEKGQIRKDNGPFIEREVDSTQLSFTHMSRGNDRAMKTAQSQTPVRRSSRRKVDGNSTGVNILGASSDRKELLGRIGCDKSSDE